MKNNGLLVDRETAKYRLTERIKLGEELLDFPGRSEEDLDNFRREHGKWDRYNRTLLKGIFTDKELIQEYSLAAMPIVVTGHETFSSRWQKVHDDIKDEISILESLLERIDLLSEPPAKIDGKPETETKGDLSKVFIIHGHDNEVKQEVARFIEKLNLEPIILHEKANAGNTIIEKIEEHSNVGFGIALYTPCDVGAKKTANPDLQDRARQNVVFEHGYLIGKLGRKNVSALVKGDIEKPNDISGVVYISLDDGHWKINLAKELRVSGFEIDMNDVI